MRERLMKRLQELRFHLVGEFGPDLANSYTWEDRTIMEIRDRNEQGVSWLPIETFEQYCELMSVAGPNTCWGGEFELMLYLYPIEYNENVAVYERRGNLYIQRQLCLCEAARARSQSAGLWHILLRRGYYYLILTHRMGASSETTTILSFLVKSNQ
jgi:hypothetical protein